MNRTIFQVCLFSALAFTLSALGGCTTTASPVDGITVKSSDYPMLADSIAQAELKPIDESAPFKVADKKGKVLLLNLWATWCGPCRQEMPVLIQLEDQHRDAGFEVIGLNGGVEDTKASVDKFAEEMKLNYTLAWVDTDTQMAMLKISQFPGIPQSFLIDREGRLRAVFRGGAPSELAKMKEIVGKVVKGEDSTITLPAANGK